MEIKDINPLWMNEGIDIKINISIWDYPFLYHLGLSFFISYVLVKSEIKIKIRNSKFNMAVNIKFLVSII